MGHSRATLDSLANTSTTFTAIRLWPRTQSFILPRSGPIPAPGGEEEASRADALAAADADCERGGFAVW